MTHFKSMNYSAIALCGALLTFPLAAQEDASPKPATQPAPAPAKVTLDQSSPEATLKSIATHIEKGQVQAVWAAVAPTHQAQIQASFSKLATKIDPEAFNAVMGVVTDVSKLLSSKSKFIANNPHLNSVSDPEEMRKSVEAMSTMLSTVTDTIGTHAKFAKLDVGQFMTTKGSEIGANLLKAAASAPDATKLTQLSSKMTIGDVELDGDNAIVLVSMEDSDEEEVPLTKIDGKWYLDVGEGVQEMADDIDEMEQMKPQDAMRATGMINMMVKPMLMQFQKCETQDEFDDAVEKVMQQAMGLMMGGMGGGR